MKLPRISAYILEYGKSREYHKLFGSKERAIQFAEENNIQNYSVLEGEEILSPTRKGKGLPFLNPSKEPSTEV